MWQACCSFVGQTGLKRSRQIRSQMHGNRMVWTGDHAGWQNGLLEPAKHNGCEYFARRQLNWRKIFRDSRSGSTMRRPIPTTFQSTVLIRAGWYRGSRRRYLLVPILLRKIDHYQYLSLEWWKALFFDDHPDPLLTATKRKERESKIHVTTSALSKLYGIEFPLNSDHNNEFIRGSYRTQWLLSAVSSVMGGGCALTACSVTALRLLETSNIVKHAHHLLM